MNLFEPLGEEGRRRFGESLGGTLWGGTVYELAPGARICPYHWHFGEEEWLVVVSGRPTLRTPDGERVLEPWDVAAFRRGEEGAHEVRNDGDAPARVVMFATCSDPEVCVYPDSGEVGVFAGWSRKDGPQVRFTSPREEGAP
jgi:uncharacterized cupin superfamily protein